MIYIVKDDGTRIYVPNHKPKNGKAICYRLYAICYMLYAIGYMWF